MKYVMMAEYANEKVTVETNDVEVLFHEVEENRVCEHLCVCDGETGEVLMCSGDEPYCTDEFALMLVGWMVMNHWDNPNSTAFHGTLCPICGQKM